jgi:hypothetical protein
MFRIVLVFGFQRETLLKNLVNVYEYFLPERFTLCGLLTFNERFLDESRERSNLNYRSVCVKRLSLVSRVNVRI